MNRGCKVESYSNKYFPNTSLTKTCQPLCLDDNKKDIPANFFWDISVRFLSWECWDFWRRHDYFRRFPKKSEVFRRSPKFSEDVRSLLKASSLRVLFTSKIRDREEGIVIYSFYTWFSFLTWVWVNIFLGIVSSKVATTHIFQSGMRNWPASLSRREIEVFNPQAWELAGIILSSISSTVMDKKTKWSWMSKFSRTDH